MVVFRDTTGRQRKRSARARAEARTLKAALTADVKRSEYVAESRVSGANGAADQRGAGANEGGHRLRSAPTVCVAPAVRRGAGRAEVTARRSACPTLPRA